MPAAGKVWSFDKVSKTVKNVKNVKNVEKGLICNGLIFVTFITFFTSITFSAEAPLHHLVVASLVSSDKQSEIFFKAISESLAKMDGYEKVESLASVPVFQAKALPRNIALFSSVLQLEHEAIFSTYWTDMDTAEVCRVQTLSWTGKEPLRNAVADLILQLGALPLPRKEKLKQDAILVAVRPFSVQLAKEGVKEGVPQAYGRLMASYAIAELLKRQEIHVVDRDHPKDLLAFQQLSGVTGGGFFNVRLILTGEISQLGDQVFIVAKLVDIKTGGVKERVEVEGGSLERLKEAAKTLVEKLNKVLTGQD